ncbi:MAG: DUF340 domain-containing protein [Synergistaceae bacterium]
MDKRQMTLFLLIFGLEVMVGNWVGATKGLSILSTEGIGAAAQAFVATVPGLVALLGIIAVGVTISRLMPWKGLPAVAYIVTLGCIVTIPGFPGSEIISNAVSKVSFIGLCTPILAYAGLAVGKDIDTLKKQGWKIVLVGLFVFVGTFIGSAVIAEMVLRYMH